MTVADYCIAMNRHEILVNREYQRNDSVWPPAARSFLIETILLDFPVPKLSLYQKTDVKTKTTIKEIVDGQQRSKAIQDFYTGRLSLSKTYGELSTLSGMKLDALPDEYQTRFLDYGLQLDLFVNATSDEVREVFRRINSYTVPLNYEEQRHAVYQGEFKWFVYELARGYDQILIDIGCLSQKQVIRMADAKLLTEVAFSLANGLKTTKKKELDDIYKTRDQSFPESADWEARIRKALEYCFYLEDIHRTSIVKPYVFHTLLLAYIHRKRRVDVLSSDTAPGNEEMGDDAVVAANLTALAMAIEQGNEQGAYGEFVKACATKTNVASHRAERFRWLYAALGMHSFA